MDSEHILRAEVSPEDARKALVGYSNILVQKQLGPETHLHLYQDSQDATGLSGPDWDLPEEMIEPTAEDIYNRLTDEQVVEFYRACVEFDAREWNVSVADLHHLQMQGNFEEAINYPHRVK